MVDSRQPVGQHCKVIHDNTYDQQAACKFQENVQSLFFCKITSPHRHGFMDGRYVLSRPNFCLSC